MRIKLNQEKVLLRLKKIVKLRTQIEIWIKLLIEKIKRLITFIEPVEILL